MEYCTGNPRKIVQKEKGKNLSKKIVFQENLGSRKGIPTHITSTNFQNLLC